MAADNVKQLFVYPVELIKTLREFNMETPTTTTTASTKYQSVQVKKCFETYIRKDLCCSLFLMSGKTSARSG